MRTVFTTLFFAFFLMCTGGNASGASLQGTKAAVEAAYQAALDSDLSFLETKEKILEFAEKGLRVTLTEGEHLRFHQVGYPYGVPAMQLFLSRLGSQYHGACNEKLVVTSLMRPKNEQPANASDFSVHPTGIAVDLRIPEGACRRWLERSLLTMEERGVIEATREVNPPHYHVVVYPKQYTLYVESKKEEVPPAASSHDFGLVPFILGALVVVGLTWFAYRLVRKKFPIRWKRFRLPRKFPLRSFLVLLVILGLTGFLYQKLLPHEGWEEDSWEVTALATALYWEGAIKESGDGLHAIAWTTFNRQASRDYPNTIREIVSQGIKPGRRDGCQFSFACDGEIELPHRLCELHPNDSKVLGFMGCELRYASYLVQALWFMTLGRGTDPTNGATLYFTGPNPYWITDCVDGSLQKIGSHKFCSSRWNS